MRKATVAVLVTASLLFAPPPRVDAQAPVNDSSSAERLKWFHEAKYGLEGLAAEIAKHGPDLVLLQEASQPEPYVPLFPGWHTHQYGQFFAASRYPLGDVYLPPKLARMAPDAPARRESKRSSSSVYSGVPL